MGCIKIYGPVYRQLKPNSGYTTRELFCIAQVHVGYNVAQALVPNAAYFSRRRCSAFDVGRAILPNAAYFLPKLKTRRKWWGGPPGPRGTPSSRCRNNDISTLQGVSRPTGASAADQGVRPTKQVRLSVAAKRMRHWALVH